MNNKKNIFIWFLWMLIFTMILSLTACTSQPSSPKIKGKRMAEGIPAAEQGAPAPAPAAPAPAPVAAAPAPGVAAPAATAEAAPAGNKQDEITGYVYKSAGLRDPFIPLLGVIETGGGTISAGTSSGKAAEVNITLLTLKGYVFSQQRKHALFKSADGSTYVLDKGKLLDDRGRVVPGVAGIVKADKVILITKKNVMKEFKLREESE